MMKRVRKSVLAILALLLVITCASMGNCSDQKVTLKFFHRYPNEPYNSFLKNVVSDFEKEHPNITIDIQSAVNDAYKEKIKIVVGSNSAPDVFFTWSGEFLYQFVRAKKVYNLTPYMQKDPAWQNSIMSSQLMPFTYRNKIYGTPFKTDVKVFFYNKKIFEQYNLKEPKTWQDFINICKLLQKEGITPISFGNKEKWEACHYITTLNQKMVPDKVRLTDYKPENGGFKNPGYIKALDMFKQLLPYCTPNPNAISHEIARTNFFNGKAAMMYLESAEIRYLSALTFDFQYGMFPFPAIPEGEGDQALITGSPDGFVVSAATKHPKEAIEFLKYLTGAKVGKEELQTLKLYNGVKNVLDRDDVDKHLLEVYNIMNNAKGMANWLDADINARIVDLYLTGIQRLIDSEATSKQVIDSVKKAAKDVSDSMK